MRALFSIAINELRGLRFAKRPVFLGAEIGVVKIARRSLIENTFRVPGSESRPTEPTGFAKCPPPAAMALQKTSKMGLGATGKSGIDEGPFKCEAP